MSDLSGLRAAYKQAALSPDPSTQNGAVVLRHARVIGYGHNRFARGVLETPERWERPAKYDRVVHAEVASIVDALRESRVDDAILYCVWYACTDCAKVILESGIRRVVGHHDLRVFAETHSPGWSDSIATALGMLDEGGVSCVWYEGPVPGAPAIRVGGELFDPSAVAVAP